MLTKAKKFILIFPNPISEMPTGFAYLSSVLKEKGYEVKAIVNSFNNFLGWDDLAEATEVYQPTFVGFHLSTYRVPDVYKTIKRIKKPGLTVIAGGPHATSCPDEALDNGVDIVVRNEGEITLSELCDFWSGARGLSLESIKGISFKDPKGCVVHNPSREYIANLNDLPKLDFSCFDQERFRTSMGLLKGFHRIYCSRGCPAGCTFCDRAIFGQKIRYHPVDEVIREIKHRKDAHNIKSFVIADDTFTFNKKYVRDFCQSLKDNKLDIAWCCSTRANIVDSEMLSTMKEAGCYMVSYGIESGDSETLKRIRKGITLGQAHKAVDCSAELGFRIYVNLMTGFPWEDELAVVNNIKYIKRHFDQVHIYQVSGAIVPYPGTIIYETYKEQYGFKDWWLKEDYQNYGLQIHQNADNPYKHSTFYQRMLYDDTLIWEEVFFPYTRAYKKKVGTMAFLIGKRNLLSTSPGRIKRTMIYALSKISRLVYEFNSDLEKTIIPKIISALHFKSRFHDRGPLGYLYRKKAKSNTTN
ncbi:MAG: B12-binding domain-containing radical SAM protein [Candidatus Omnitrophica bacterium]|nr:B12-binding domain-containing radical SAM protein [Candidatus Omnitrophota bacterium]